jgi:hypothetical protein
MPVLRLREKKNLPGRGVTKVEDPWSRHTTQQEETPSTISQSRHTTQQEETPSTISQSRHTTQQEEIPSTLKYKSA